MCAIGCALCSVSSINCTKCTNVTGTQYYLISTANICVTSCPPGQFTDPSTNNKCASCATGCALCSGLASTCTQCFPVSNQNYYLSAITSSCSTTCAAGQYINTNLPYQCSLCATGCAVCSGIATNCAACTNITNGGVIIYYLSANSNICTTTCPFGQFIDSTKNN